MRKALDAILRLVPTGELTRALMFRGVGVRSGPWDDDDDDAPVFDEPEFVEAEACFRRGDVAEALIWLERALPDTFAGLSTAAVPARSS